MITGEIWASRIGQQSQIALACGRPRAVIAVQLWLSAVPYGMWSEEVSRPSLEEHQQWVQKLEHVIQGALDHFALSLYPAVSVNDLASAIASMTEGIWLNQCLTTRHPSDPAEPIATALRRSGRLLWRGATQPIDEPADLDGE